MERPILFSTPMVQAILDERKTQTRRIVKISDLIKDADKFHYVGSSKELDIPRKAIPYDDRLYHAWRLNNNNMPMWVIHSHKPGDILWVRETWRPTTNSMPIGWPYDYRATAKEDGVPEEGPWKPSIFMPKEACRIKLMVKNIRVERVQEISEEDACMEGMNQRYEKDADGLVIYDGRNIEAYSDLWESINGKGSWDKNPWVWVIEFKKL